MNLKKYILVGFVAVLGLSSCGKFEKFRKSADLPTKYKAAVNYYKKKDFSKAGILFDEIMPLMKGDSTQELATFYQAYCDFNLGSYTLASSHFKKFAEVFSRSEFAEEAIYMSAFSLYKDSPNFNLDQTGTLAAINEIQSYLNNYPETKFKDDCTNIIKELRKKLEKKAYEKAKLYYKTSPFNIASLKSSVIEITNFQRDFPDSDYSEEMAYMKVLAQFDLAKSTIESKQKERYTEASKFYLDLIDKYPQSAYLKEGEKMYELSNKEVDRIAKLEAEYKAMVEKEKSNTSKVATGPQ
ncbi:MAG: outer membrane protein assembly factor BamD [Cytophagia bacterium]|nr:outer membrane protein assembly factor BamD [Cytophagia bacterium]